jgi:acyl-CoA reductase-like NAD-dependent aldehyde dehydrogenase
MTSLVARVEKTRKLRQRIETRERGSEPVDVGAIVFPRQIDTIEDHVNDAIARGAHVLTGGSRATELGGRFYQPTVLTDVDHSMSIMTDETFWPVLPIMRVRDADEALRLANDSRYGLNASDGRMTKRAKGLAGGRRKVASTIPASQ